MYYDVTATTRQLESKALITRRSESMARVSDILDTARTYREAYRQIDDRRKSKHAPFDTPAFVEAPSMLTLDIETEDNKVFNAFQDIMNTKNMVVGGCFMAKRVLTEILELPPAVATQVNDTITAIAPFAGRVGIMHWANTAHVDEAKKAMVLPSYDSVLLPSVRAGTHTRNHHNATHNKFCNLSNNIVHTHTHIRSCYTSG